MKNKLTILTCIGLLSCGAMNNCRDELEGIWIYQPTTLFGDTVYASVENSFTDTTQYLTIRKLDSGLFVFKQLNNEIVLLEPYTDKHACQFKFNTDTSGTISHFTFNPQLRTPKYSIYDTVVQNFSISKGNLYCMITSFEDSVDVTMIDQFHKDSLLFIPTSNLKIVLHRL